MTTTRSNITELAEAAGISRDRAKRILNDACVSRDAYRLYDHAKAMAALVAATDASRASGHKLNGHGSDEGRANISANMEKLASARADAESMRARKLQLEISHKEGRFLDRKTVESAGRDLVVMARTAFLALGKKVAPRLLGLTDQAEIARIVEDEARRALGALASEDAFMDEVLG